MSQLPFTTNCYFLKENQLEQLSHKWLALEAQSNSSIFVTWFWIKQWLANKDLSNNNCICIEVTAGENIVGLALFGIKRKRVFWGLNFNQYFLHKSGNIKEDQTWIEQNTFLVHKEYAQQSTKQICLALENIPTIDDIKIGMSSPSFINELEISGFKQRKELSSTGYMVNLSGLQTLEDYLASLSRNTRSHIKRSLKLLDEGNSLKLVLASDTTEKEKTLGDIAELHRKRWRSTIYGSGFDNPVFYKFHRNLIKQDTSGTQCRLYTLFHNSEALGHVYLLTNGKTWTFYLSAINFDKDNRIKVGLVIHTLIIEQAIKLDVTTYDFLAGEAQYKSSLSNSPPYEQHIYCFYRQKPLLLIREQLRKWKHMIFGGIYTSLRTKLNG
ncbi:GNAT family N-acetyltransferase [Paraglaciecola sp. 2405UD69-4]|uniref:GNAT family N-acetyltransferase n=1 Tax=Paraglaciecola sp. 2405UD69-4 TaxID=3391836 RepID=UPI0039C98516